MFTGNRQPARIVRLSAGRALILLLSLVLLTASATVPALADQLRENQPKLVVVLVVDQLSYDLLPRYNDTFGTNGFKYLQNNGAVFTNCRYKQATTHTAVGHSIIASGAYPWSTGVVANEWFDRQKKHEVVAVADDAVKMVGASGPGTSARSMAGTTFGDSLKLASNGRSRVIALSLKDRGAVFLAGKLGNGAYWFDTHSGNFVSGSQFGGKLPAWVQEFNEKKFADQFFGKEWERLLSENRYTASERDDCPGEGVWPGGTCQFPHAIAGSASEIGQKFYGTFVITPFANQMLTNLAVAAIEKEKLGQNNDTDVLTISFSQPDYAGHMFGPQSQEVQDSLIRLDREVARLIELLSQKVGLNKCLIVVTGDHGVSALPEVIRERGQTRGFESGRINPRKLVQTLDAELDARLGPDDWIASFTPPNLYLNPAAIDRQKLKEHEVTSLAGNLAHQISGVAAVVTSSQLFTNQLPNSPFAEAIRRSYYWGRSGDLYIMPKPGYFFSGASSGTSHGTAYAYDQQVPLILTGGAISPGKYGQEASPADIAPTICSILSIGMPPLCEGRVLQEALTATHKPPAPTKTQQQVSMKTRKEQAGSLRRPHARIY